MNSLKKPRFILIKQLLHSPIFFVIMFALVLRLWGIWHGYPFSYYGDEQHFVNRAVSFGSGDLNPHWFHKPAFLMYLLFFEYGIFFVIGKVIGLFPTLDSFAISYFQDPWPFILIGRITVTLFGVSTIYVVYKIGEKFWSKSVGLYSSVFLALSYGHIFCGQDVKADVVATFFSALSVFYILNIVNNDYKKRDFILAGLFAGLGAATKYYSIALLPCILIATIYGSVSKKNILIIKNYLYTLLCFWGIHFLASPYNFLDYLGRRAAFGRFINLFNKVSPLKIPGYAELEGTTNFLAENYQGNYLYNSFIHYVKIMLETEGVGIIIGVIFIISICFIFFKPCIKRVLLLSFPILFSIISIVMCPSYTEARHQLIVYPFFAIAAGIFLCAIHGRLGNKFKINDLVLVLLIFPLVFIVKNNIYISKTDTRTLAKYWIESNIPANTRLILDEESPILKMSKNNLEEYYERSKSINPGQFTTHLEKYYSYQMKGEYEITYDIKEIRHIWWRDKEISDKDAYATTEYDKDMANPVKMVGVNDLEFYIKDGYKYVVTSSYAYASYMIQNKKSINFPSYKKFYEDLFSKGEIIKEFNAEQLRLPGPTIMIIKI